MFEHLLSSLFPLYVRVGVWQVGTEHAHSGADLLVNGLPVRALN